MGSVVRVDTLTWSVAADFQQAMAAQWITLGTEVAVPRRAQSVDDRTVLTMATTQSQESTSSLSLRTVQPGSFDLLLQAISDLAALAWNADEQPGPASFDAVRNWLVQLVEYGGPTPQVANGGMGDIEIQWLVSGTLVTLLVDDVLTCLMGSTDSGRVLFIEEVKTGQQISEQTLLSAKNELRRMGECLKGRRRIAS